MLPVFLMYIMLKEKALKHRKPFLKQLVTQGEHLARYTISFHVVFPVLVMVFLGLLFHHLIENYKVNLFRVKFATIGDDNIDDDASDDERK